MRCKRLVNLMLMLIGLLLAVIVLPGFAIALPQTEDSAESDTHRPNIVWLVSEDNSIHYLRMFDKQGIETPRIEQLAASGLTFHHAFSNSPVCSVARTTLMTGCYAPRIGTQFHRRSQLVPMPDGLLMFPAYLRDAGYYTTNNRKKDYNVVEADNVWNKSGQADWRERGEGQPFFHMQSFTTTHEGSLHFPVADVKDNPTRTDPASVFVAPYHPQTELFRYTNARYRDRIQTVDAEIGEVVDRLVEDGLLEDTFIFYFGDHGGVLPRSKGYVYESGLHVPLVVRVPVNFRHLIDADRGTDVDGFVSFIDFAPTVLNLAGIEVPGQMDGRAFLGPDVNSEEVKLRDETFGYADRFDEKYDLVRSLRKRELKYIRSYQPFNFDGLQNNYRYKMAAYREWRELFEAGRLNEIQSRFFRPRHPEALYDLANDPHETVNLIGDPAYAEQLVAMRNRLNQIVVGMPDLSFYPESYLVENAFENPVQFGIEHADEIARLVETADLAIGDFSQNSDAIADALNDPDQWIRYWAVNVCHSRKERDAGLSLKLKQLAEHDSCRLVRVYASAFSETPGQIHLLLGLSHELAQTESPIEALEILNLVVMLRDGETKLDIPVSLDELKESVRNDEQVRRRLLYLGLIEEQK